MKLGILGLGRIGKVPAVNPSMEGQSFPQRYGIPQVTYNAMQALHNLDINAPPEPIQNM